MLLTSTRGIACPCGDPCRTSNRGFLSLHWNCNIRNFRELFATSWRYIQCGVLSPDHTRCSQCRQHYSDVIMSAMASQITGISTVYTTVCLGADKRKHQSSVSLAFVRGIHRWPVDSPSQRTSDAEKVSIWWHHHALSDPMMTQFTDEKGLGFITFSLSSYYLFE